MVVCSPPHSMCDITIHPPSGPSVFPFRAFPQGFKTHLLEEGFHTLYKWWSVLLFIQCGTSQSTPFRAQHPRWHSFLTPINVGPPPNPPPLGPNVLTDTPSRVYSLWGTARRLAHRLKPGSDTICNALNSPLADIVLFELSLSGFASRL